MRIQNKIGFLLILLTASCVARPSFSAEPGLERELARLANVSAGTIGVAAIHIESGNGRGSPERTLARSHGRRPQNRDHRRNDQRCRHHHPS